MANPPITIPPFTNVPAPGSPIKSDWPQQVTHMLVDAWIGSTPTLDQGVLNIGKTVNYSKYKQIGFTVFWTFNLTVTGAGTAGQGIKLALPVAATHAQSLWGVAHIFDGPATRYICAVGGDGVTRVYFVASGNNADVVGVTPNFGLAAGDQITGHITYEAGAPAAVLLPAPEQPAPEPKGDT